ncbi:MAG: hypothetical protein NTW82_12045 [Bacteroidia bacterium]|nr:hypothetical protein [Bacteroidia bacterium]
MNITRTNFLQKLIRILLFSILGLIALALGSRAVSGSSCNKCPGNGICKGETDCNKFLPIRNERRKE